MPSAKLPVTYSKDDFEGNGSLLKRQTALVAFGRLFRAAAPNYCLARTSTSRGMIRLMSPSEETVNMWLSSSAAWYDRGSDLYQTAVFVRDNRSAMYGPSLIVGGHAVANIGLLTPGEFNIDDHRRQIIPAMLLSFAVECWLKGILVAKLRRRESVRLRNRLSQKIDDFIASAGIQDPEAWQSLLWDALADEDIARLACNQDQERANEDKDRATQVRRHPSHDLVRLAEFAGMPDLDVHRQYLDFLSAANILGRYPAHHRPAKNLHWDDCRAVDPTRWDVLNAAIKRAYDEALAIELEERFTVLPES